MTDNPIVQIIMLAPMFVMGWKGFITALSEGKSRYKRIMTSIQYGFVGWMMSLGLYALFSFGSAASR